MKGTGDEGVMMTSHQYAVRSDGDKGDCGGGDLEGARFGGLVVLSLSAAPSGARLAAIPHLREPGCPICPSICVAKLLPGIKFVSQDPCVCAGCYVWCRGSLLCA